MKILMFGWEFPPNTSGGLGTACYLLSKGLVKNNIKITFVVPYAPEINDYNFVNIIGTNEIKNVEIISVASMLVQYATAESYEDKIKRLNMKIKELYGHGLYEEVLRYSIAAAKIAENIEHDVIHCHDWMTYQAGINAKKISGKPLVVHIHNTVFDRGGNNPNKNEYMIEKLGFESADVVIAISNKIKDTLISKYKINHEKIVVVHWGIEEDDPDYDIKVKKPFKTKIVMFVGRITIQKGPDYFIEAAKKILDYEPDTRFIMVGAGDMMPQIINRTIDLGINDKITFTGWFSKKEVCRAFKFADIFVMPSVSEPFGLVALEAVKSHTPVIVSKQSGVSEVLKHCLKIDFWDIDELANKIISLLRYNSLHSEIKANSIVESRKFNLDTPAKKVIDIYKGVANW